LTISYFFSACVGLLKRRGGGKKVQRREKRRLRISFRFGHRVFAVIAKKKKKKRGESGNRGEKKEGEKGLAVSGDHIEESPAFATSSCAE